MALLLRRGCDTGHEFGYAANCRNNLLHRLARLGDERRATVYFGNRCADQLLDFLGGIGTALRQGAHFRGNDGKSSALFAGAGCFDCGIEGEDIGLKRDAVNNGGDLRNAFRASADFRHGLHRFSGDLAAAHRGIAGVRGALVGLARILGACAHRGGEFFGACRRFFQRGCLLFGALGQAVVTHLDLIHGRVNRLGAGTHLPNDIGQGPPHLVHGGDELARFVCATGFGRPVIQMTARDARRHAQSLPERARHLLGEQDRKYQRSDYRQQGDDQYSAARRSRGGVRSGDGFAVIGFEKIGNYLQLCFQSFEELQKIRHQGICRCRV